MGDQEEEGEDKRLDSGEEEVEGPGGTQGTRRNETAGHPTLIKSVCSDGSRVIRQEETPPRLRRSRAERSASAG